MLRWRWVLLLWLVGGAMTAYGVWIEFEVRASVGTGARRVLARMFYREAIDEYRWFSTLCASAGPALIVLAFLLRRNWDRARESRWLHRQAEKLLGKAEWWQQQGRRLARKDPAAAEAAKRKAERLQRKSQRLSEKALRKLPDGEA